MQRPRHAALVVTLGSTLAGEDTVGWHVHNALQGTIDARVIHLGTDIFRFSNAYRDEPQVVFVDAVYAQDLPAGEIVHFEGDEVFSELDDVATDAHMLGVGEGLRVLREVMPRFPENLHFVGVSCTRFGHGELSREAEQGIERAVALVRRLVDSRGISAGNTGAR